MPFADQGAPVVVQGASVTATNRREILYFGDRRVAGTCNPQRIAKLRRQPVVVDQRVRESCQVSVRRCALDGWPELIFHAGRPDDFVNDDVSQDLNPIRATREDRHNSRGRISSREARQVTKVMPPSPCDDQAGRTRHDMPDALPFRRGHAILAARKAGQDPIEEWFVWTMDRDHNRTAQGSRGRPVRPRTNRVSGNVVAAW